MAFNVEQVADLGIVRDWQDEEIRPQAASLSSCHLTVGTIIGPNGQEESPEGYTLEPQEVVTIVSHERLKLPDTIFGYIMPRYTLNDQGILALSTGIVDPGYEGLISSTLINFSNEGYGLSREQPFLRVTFHEIERLLDQEWSKEITKRQSSDSGIPSDDYVTKRKRIAGKFPETFLNIPLTAQQVAEEVAHDVAEARFQSASELLSKGATSVAFIALVVAIVIFLLTPITSELTTSSITERVSARMASEEIEPLQDDIQELREEVNRLQDR
jgi:dUTPase